MSSKSKSSRSNTKKASIQQVLRRVAHNEGEKLRKRKLIETIDLIIDLLPMKCAGNTTRISRLEQLHAYILELRNKNDGLMFANASSVHVQEILQLKAYVQHLEKMNSNYRKLLKTAGISENSALELGDRDWKKPLKYSNKIYLDSQNSQNPTFKELIGGKRKGSETDDDEEEESEDDSDDDNDNINNTESEYESNSNSSDKNITSFTNGPSDNKIVPSTNNLLQLNLNPNQQPIQYILLSGGPNQPAQLVPIAAPLSTTTNTTILSTANQTTTNLQQSTSQQNTISLSKVTQDSSVNSRLLDKKTSKSNSKSKKSKKQKTSKSNESLESETENLINETIPKTTSKKTSLTTTIEVNKATSDKAVDQNDKKMVVDKRKSVDENVELDKKSKTKPSQTVDNVTIIPDKANSLSVPAQLNPSSSPLVYQVEDDVTEPIDNNNPTISSIVENSSTNSNATQTPTVAVNKTQQSSQTQAIRCNYSTESLLQQTVQPSSSSVFSASVSTSLVSSTLHHPTIRTRSQTLNQVSNTNTNHQPQTPTIQPSVTTSNHPTNLRVEPTPPQNNYQSISTFTVKDSLINNSSSQTNNNNNNNNTSNTKDLDPNTNSIITKSSSSSSRNPGMFDLDSLSFNNPSSLFDTSASDNPGNALMNLWNSSTDTSNHVSSNSGAQNSNQNPYSSTNPGVFFSNQPFSILSGTNPSQFDPTNVVPNVTVYGNSHKHSSTSSTSNSFQNSFMPDFSQTVSSYLNNSNTTLESSDTQNDNSSQILDFLPPPSRSTRSSTASIPSSRTTTQNVRNSASYATTTTSKSKTTSKASSTPSSNTSSNLNTRASSSKSQVSVSAASSTSKKSTAKSTTSSNTSEQKLITPSTTSSTTSSNTSSNLIASSPLSSSSNLFSSRHHHGTTSTTHHGNNLLQNQNPTHSHHRSSLIQDHHSTNYLHVIQDIISPAAPSFVPSVVPGTGGSSGTHQSGSSSSSNVPGSSGFHSHHAHHPTHHHHPAHPHHPQFGYPPQIPSYSNSIFNQDPHQSYETQNRNYDPSSNANESTSTSTNDVTDLNNSNTNSNQQPMSSYPFFQALQNAQSHNFQPITTSSTTSSTYQTSSTSSRNFNPPPMYPTHPTRHQGSTSSSSSHFTVSNLLTDNITTSHNNNSYGGTTDFGSTGSSSTSKNPRSLSISSSITSSATTSSSTSVPSATSNFLPKFSHLTKSLPTSGSLDPLGSNYQNPTGAHPPPHHQYHPSHHFAYPPPPPPQTSVTYSSTHPLNSHPFSSTSSSTSSNHNRSTTNRSGSTTSNAFMVGTETEIDTTSRSSALPGHYYTPHITPHNGTSGTGSDMVMFAAPHNQNLTAHHHQTQHHHNHSSSSASSTFNQIGAATAPPTPGSTFNINNPTGAGNFGAGPVNSAPPPPALSFPLFNIPR